MADISALAGALSSLKAAKDIAEAMIGLRDAGAFQGKMIEFQSKILDAQSKVFSAQDERAALIEKISDLEKTVARLEAWDTDKQKYQLKEIYTGSFAYALKEEAGGAESPHWICAACYEDHKKMILQGQARYYSS